METISNNKPMHQVIVTETLSDEAMVQIKANDEFVTAENETAQRTHGAAQKRADAFSLTFGGAWWNQVEEKSDAGKAIRLIKKDLYTKLKAAGHSNPSVQWGRILDKAGRPAPTKAEDGGSVTGLDARIVKEITALTKAIRKDDHASVNALKCNKHLMTVLEIYGITIED
jgi:hypothetical protein